MKARAVRLHAANDLRLDTFELPEIRDDEILSESKPRCGFDGHCTMCRYDRRCKCC